MWVIGGFEVLRGILAVERGFLRIVEVKMKSRDLSADREECAAAGVEISGEGDLLGDNEVSKRTQCRII